MIVRVIISLTLSVVIIQGRHVDNRTINQNNQTDTDSNCLHACLDECMEWRNSSFTSEDCLIPCAVYIEETERFMNEHSGAAFVHHCNDTRGSAVDLMKAEKPGKTVIRMTRETTSNITEIWWTHVASATAYRIEVWCRDRQNDTMLYEDETWLTWYAFRQCSDKCPKGKRARVAAWNSFGVGPYSEFSDRLEEIANTTGMTDLIADERRPFKLFGLTLN